MEETKTEAPSEAAPLPVKSNQKSGIEVTETGQVGLVSLQDQLAFAQRLISERMVSESFKNPQQVVIGIQYCKALKINELLGLRMMYVVNGKPCLYGEGPLALCHRQGVVQDIEEFFLDESGKRISVEGGNLGHKVFASVTRIWRQGQRLPQEDFFTLKDLEAAGVDKNSYGKKKDVWEKWERIMMRYKARSMALKSKFADVIAGVPIAEYDEHFTPELPDVKPAAPPSIADEINGATAGDTREITASSESGSASASSGD